MPESLYDKDFYEWTQRQAQTLRHLGLVRKKVGSLPVEQRLYESSRFADGFFSLDFENLAEEVEDLGKSQERAIGSYLCRIIKHLLKLKLQPARQFQHRGWRRSVETSRDDIERILDNGQSLRNRIPEMILKEYPRAVRQAASETGLSRENLPDKCPYSDEQLLSHGVWPVNG